MTPDEIYYWDGLLPETQAPETTPEPWKETRVVGKPLVRVDAYDRLGNGPASAGPFTFTEPKYTKAMMIRTRTDRMP